MTCLSQTRFRRGIAASAICILAVAIVAALMALIPNKPTEARSPQADARQQVSGYDDDMLMRHGIRMWHEQNLDGMTTGGERLKVGIIDTGFDGWRTSARQGLLPEPPDLDDDENDRVFTKCWIKDGNDWNSSDFDGCEAPNYDAPIPDTHGTSVAETIAAIAPEVVFYISNAPDEEKRRDVLDWMERNGVVVINRSLHGDLDLGLHRLTPQQSADLYELVITSNRAVDEWLSIFDDPILGNSALDRLANASYQIVIEGASNRERPSPHRALPGMAGGD